MARQLPTKGPNTYVKQYWNWLQQYHKGSFKSWTTFFKTKCFSRHLKSRKLFETFKERAEGKCDFAHPSLQIDDTLNLLYDVQNAVSAFAATIPSEHLDTILMEALRLTYLVPPENPEDEDPRGQTA